MKRRWAGLCSGLGCDAMAGWAILAANYGEEGRYYHDLRHIASCLAVFDHYRELADDPPSIELALWFHDLIYDTRGKDNERRSADAALAFLDGMDVRRRVEELIMATRHDVGPLAGDRAFMADIDLHVLGAGDSVYDAYAAAIRKEYAWVPEQDYAKGRAAVLAGFLARDHIYHTTQFRESYEERARENLGREVHRLSH